MKQLLCLICAWILLMVTIGCGAQQQESAGGSNSPSAAESSAEAGSTATEPGAEIDSTEPLESATPGSEQPVSNTVTGNYGYTLREIATIPNTDQSIYADDLGLYMKTENGKMLLTNMGEAKISQDFERIDHLGNGIFAVRTDYDDVNHAGVVTMDGDILIPFNAALIDWAHSTYSDSERFLEVIYATDETTNRDECIIYSSNEIRLGVGEGDTMYAGYARVYDVVERQFVEGVTLSNKDSLKPCGNHFLIAQDGGMTTLYDAAGKAIAKYEQVRYVGNGIFLIQEGSKYIMCDETANEIYSTEQNILQVTDSSSRYFLETDKQYSQTFVHDKQGKVVFSTEHRIISERDDIFTVKNDDNKYGLMRVDGLRIVPCSSYSLTAIGYGYYRARNFETDQFTLIGPHGVVAGNLTGYNFMQEKDGMLLVLNTGEFTLPAEGMYELKDVLAYGGKDGMYGLFDLFTGEQLLPYEYKNISYGLGYVYANKGDEWVIFELSGPVN